MQKITRLAGLACATSVIAGGMSADLAAEDGLGYTDIRLYVGTNPTDGFSGGLYYSTPRDFEDGFRVGALMIGPLCEVLPVGCDTTPRTRKAVAERKGELAAYDDSIIGDDFTFDDSSYSYDILLGFEVSGNTWTYSGEPNSMAGFYGQYAADPMELYQLQQLGLGNLLNLGSFYNFTNYVQMGPGEPDVDLVAAAVDLHLGWGFEIGTRTKGRWQVEITGFGGLGAASVDFTDAFTGASDDGDGLFWEVGARVGTYYTFARGFQIGAHAGYVYQKAEIDVFDSATDLGMSGAQLALDFGYRF